MNHISDVYPLIFSFLHIPDILSYGGCNKELQSLSVSDGTWAEILQNYQPLSIVTTSYEKVKLSYSLTSFSEYLLVSGRMKYKMPINMLYSHRLITLNCCFKIIDQKIPLLLNLTTLYLRGCKLNIFPPEIKKLINLECLHLDNNNIQILSPDIGKMVNLQHLSLDRNKLALLPFEIFQLTKLCHLSLADNLVSKIPPEISKLSKLTNLYIAGNPLATISAEITKLRYLRCLGLETKLKILLPLEFRKKSDLMIYTA